MLVTMSKIPKKSADEDASLSPDNANKKMTKETVKSIDKRNGKQKATQAKANQKRKKQTDLSDEEDVERSATKRKRSNTKANDSKIEKSIISRPKRNAKRKSYVEAADSSDNEKDEDVEKSKLKRKRKPIK